MRVACGVRRVTCVRRACGMFRRDAKDSTRRAVNVYDDGGRTGDGRADGGGDDDDGGDDDMRAPDRQGRVGGFHVAGAMSRARVSETPRSCQARYDCRRGRRGRTGDDGRRRADGGGGRCGGAGAATTWGSGCVHSPCARPLEV